MGASTHPFGHNALDGVGPAKPNALRYPGGCADYLLSGWHSMSISTGGECERGGGAAQDCTLTLPAPRDAEIANRFAREHCIDKRPPTLCRRVPTPVALKLLSS